MLINEFKFLNELSQIVKINFPSLCEISNYSQVSTYDRGRDIKGEKASTTRPILCKRCVIYDWLIYASLI